MIDALKSSLAMQADTSPDSKRIRVIEDVHFIEIPSTFK